MSTKINRLRKTSKTPQYMGAKTVQPTAMLTIRTIQHKKFVKKHKLISTAETLL